MQRGRGGRKTISKSRNPIHREDCPTPFLLRTSRRLRQNNAKMTPPNLIMARQIIPGNLEMENGQDVHYHKQTEYFRDGRPLIGSPVVMICIPPRPALSPRYPRVIFSVISRYPALVLALPRVICLDQPGRGLSAENRHR